MTDNPDQKPTEPNALVLGMPLGLGAGIALGVSIGLAMDNIAIGIPIGIALGMALSLVFGQARLQELRKKRDAAEDSDASDEEKS